MIDTIQDVLEDVKKGRMVILVDDEARENEGDLFIPAACVDAAVINFMATHGRGLICLPLAGEIVDRLGLPQMVCENQSSYQTAFTISIGAAKGITTGISAADRAHTVLVAINERSSPADIVSPGHIFPLRAREGGVLARAGHTEAAVDMARLAGYAPAGVICEIMNEDGTMARLPQLSVFAKKHGLKMGSIADLIAYRKVQEEGKAA